MVYFTFILKFILNIGIITYMILSASLPFDHPTSEKEIARYVFIYEFIRITIYEPVKYNQEKWSLLSPEAKDFVESKLYNYFNYISSFFCRAISKRSKKTNDHNQSPGTLLDTKVHKNKPH